MARIFIINIIVIIEIGIKVMSIEMGQFHILRNGEVDVHVLRNVRELKGFLNIVQTQNMEIM